MRRIGEMQNDGEQQDICGEEPISDGDKARARQRLDEIGERHVEQQQPGERRCEQPLQIVDAARDAHLLADRPHDVIGRQNREDVEPCPGQRRHFLRLDGGQPPRRRIQKTGAIRSAGAGTRVAH
jgi:hypothetical protein